MEQQLSPLLPQDFSHPRFEDAVSDPICGNCNAPLGEAIKRHAEALRANISKITELREAARNSSPRLAATGMPQLPVPRCPHCRKPLSPAWLAARTSAAA